MYVLVVARGYPSESYKTNGVFEFDQAKALSDKGHKVIFASVDLRSIRKKRRIGFETLQLEGVIIEGISIPLGPIPFIFEPVGTTAFKILLKKIIKKYGTPDIIHAHFLTSGYQIAHLNKKIHSKLIITEHLSLLNKDEIENKYVKLGDFTYKNVDKVICVSEGLKNKIETNFETSSIVIPNIVDFSLFHYENNLSTEKDIQNDIDYKFICVANLVENKNLSLLIHSFYKCFRNKPNVFLNIYGKGPKRHELNRLITKYKMDKNILLHGEVNRNEIAYQLKTSDCFVLPSKSETFGVAYIEALASGVPVIATKCGGPEEFIHEKNGLLIDNNGSSLEDALNIMFENSYTYDKFFISKEVISKYSPDVVASKLENVYSQVLKKI